MAVFLLKASLGAAYVPPPCTPPGVFPDVPCPGDPPTFAVDWIEDLYHRGIVAGYVNGNYGPNDPVTRAEMAVLLLRTSLGTDYAPPPCTPPGDFTDVPCPGDPPTFAVNWIEDLYHRGIAAGYGNGKYGPDDSATRGEMAVFLVKTFGLQ
jgi:N-acetylmuramoyl-L-alanine amidase